MVALGIGRSVLLLSAGDLSLLHELHAPMRRRAALPGAGAVAAAFSPDGLRLAVAGGEDPTRILVWDTLGGRVVAALTGHRGVVTGLAFRPVSAPGSLEPGAGGHQLVSCSSDGAVLAWKSLEGPSEEGQVERFKVVAMAGSPALCVAVSPAYAGSRVVVGGLDGRVGLWEGRPGGALLGAAAGKAGVVALALSPDGRLLLVAGAGSACQLWGVLSFARDRARAGAAAGRGAGRLISIADAEFGGGAPAPLDSPLDTGYHADLHFDLRHDSLCLDVGFSSDSARAITSSLDHTCKIWGSDTGLLLFQINTPVPITRIKVMPLADGVDALVTCCGDRLVVFSVTARSAVGNPGASPATAVGGPAAVFGDDWQRKAATVVERHKELESALASIVRRNYQGGFMLGPSVARPSKKTNLPALSTAATAAAAAARGREVAEQADLYSAQYRMIPWVEAPLPPWRGGVPSLTEMRKSVASGMFPLPVLARLVIEATGLAVQPGAGLLQRLGRYPLQASDLIKAITGGDYEPADVLRALTLERSDPLFQAIMDRRPIHAAMSALGLAKAPTALDPTDLAGLLRIQGFRGQEGPELARRVDGVAGAGAPRGSGGVWGQASRPPQQGVAAQRLHRQHQERHHPRGRPAPVASIPRAGGRQHAALEVAASAGAPSLTPADTLRVPGSRRLAPLQRPPQILQRPPTIPTPSATRFVVVDHRPAPQNRPREASASAGRPQPRTGHLKPLLGSADATPPSAATPAGIYMMGLSVSFDGPELALRQKNLLFHRPAEPDSRPLVVLASEE